MMFKFSTNYEFHKKFRRKSYLSLVGELFCGATNFLNEVLQKKKIMSFDINDFLFYFYECMHDYATKIVKTWSKV